MNGTPGSSYLEEVQKHAGITFRHFDILAYIVDRGKDPSRNALYEEILFTAKFISHAQKILNRTGTAGEETGKLSREFSEAITRLTGMMENLSERTLPAGVPRFWDVTSSAAIPGFLGLCGELSSIYSFELDKTGPRKRPPPGP